VWSRNKANLYIRDALNEFEPNFKHPCFSPPAQHRMYKQKLMATHLIGFGSGVGVSAPVPSSYEFDGSGDTIYCGDHADFDVSTGNFTIDFWVYFSTLSATVYLCRWYSGGVGIYWVVYDNGLIDFWGGDPSGSINPIGNVGAVSTGAWTHIAMVRNGSSGKMWVDGVEDAEDASAGGDLGEASGNFTIGNSLNGYMDEFRFSDVARWTSDFSGSLPTEEYTSDANTLVLIHCNETIVSGTTGSGATFVDSGNTGHTFTEGGDAIRNTSTYKF